MKDSLIFGVPKVLLAGAVAIIGVHGNDPKSMQIQSLWQNLQFLDRPTQPKSGKWNQQKAVGIRNRILDWQTCCPVPI